MHLLQSVLIGICGILVVGPTESSSLKVLGLSIEPAAVHRGGYATLRCIYELRGAPLYSVKWYRGRHEFYRYSPSELPANKIFPFPGIYVDLLMSNASQVVLREVGFNLAGNFSCEVTAEAPSFSTATAANQMIVVEVPDAPPVLITERDRYDPGDVLRANCTTPPSKPAASITFLLNNVPIEGNDPTTFHSTEDSLQLATRTLTAQLLPSHYSGGRLVLRCSAEILITPLDFWGLHHSVDVSATTTNAALYSDSAEIVLGRIGDPRPERVTSPSSASTFAELRLILLFGSLSNLLAKSIAVFS